MVVVVRVRIIAGRGRWLVSSVKLLYIDRCMIKYIKIASRISFIKHGVRGSSIRIEKYVVLYSV